MSITNVDHLCINCMREKPTTGVCPFCGFDEAQYEPSPHHLPPRSILAGKYLTGRVLYTSSFCIVYVALDLNLELKLAIEECFPIGTVWRNCDDSCTVTTHDKEDTEIFLKDRSYFLETATLLSKQPSLPGIVSTRDTFLENATAYMTMDSVESETLHRHLEKHSGKLEAPAFLDWIRPLIGSLAQFNASGILHRDISPMNIIVTTDNRLVLIGFYMAEGYGGNNKHGVPFSVYTKYSAVEQYIRGLTCGQWTDVYSLCATIYRTITGVTPQSCMDRHNRDELQAPSILGAKISSAQEAALLKGLAVRPGDRWQTMQQLYDALYLAPTPSI